ncbi:protein kinase-like protein [Novosphingobium kunmingense]|uniref:Protein kinase-like protein n=2 Tax=Novosphingobium kunmingense TaxID=1211806 RepID=A0A2N0H5A0_9SPHN|nr:protein kinase-like protein [Novosphingobium kunmingense]
MGTLAEKYEGFRVISSGKNSIVVEARHRLLGTNVVLKLVRPGAATDIRHSVRMLSGLRSDSAIVAPQDFLEVIAKDALGKPVRLHCLVFPFIEGITFREFLQQANHHLNSQVAISFARQIGRALAELEELGAYHGDLHDGNIMVDQHAKGGIRFRIVDISFGAMGSLPFEVCRNNDLANYKQHIWRLLRAQRASVPNMSIRKYIGTRHYLKIMDVLSPGSQSFATVCRALQDDGGYASYVLAKEAFVTEKFETPVSFRLQRYEEIIDPSVAVELFVPFEQLMEKIRDYGNIYVSGNRGSGKSTYLASLAFFPNASSDVVDFRQTFGVYFPCRQGEFAPLATRSDWDGALDRRLITGIMIVKIIRRTLEIISAGVSAKELREPTQLAALRQLLGQFVPAPGIVSVESDIQTELENLVSTMVRVEMDEVARIPDAFVGPGEREPRVLMQFFSLVRDAFPDLISTRFHLLFDDAGAPYVPRNVQAVINDLMLSSNPLFCVKLSAEKLTFDFKNSSGKALENGQDYVEHDISQILFIGSAGSGGLARRELERYFRRIIEQRLIHFQYQSSDITDYLGDQQISVERLQDLLSRQAHGAYYAGWSTVWNIADRTPRNLLEIVSEIFVVSNIDRKEAPRVASTRDQDRAIRTISEKRLESLSQISGTIIIDGQRVSLGRRLFEVTSALGSTFRKYLRAEADKRRKRQYLAIERNDFADLTSEAETVLRRLITFGVLDAGRSGFARDDVLKKPFYVLNRIYCPAFSIGYQRDAHLRLSKGKLEMLLLSPAAFAKQGTSRLRQGDDSMPDLFDYRDPR